MDRYVIIILNNIFIIHPCNDNEKYEQKLKRTEYRWQCVKTSLKQNAQCSANTITVSKQTDRVFDTSIFCHIGRLCIRILVHDIDNLYRIISEINFCKNLVFVKSHNARL